MLWQLPGPVLGSTRRFKYRLFYGTAKRWAVGYDNERGKGDNRHWDGVEESYKFVSLDMLLTDFEAGVARLRGSEVVSMVDTVKVAAGGSLADDLAALRSAWERAERGNAVQPEIVLTFESWEGLAKVLTGERYKLPRHLRAHPEPSVSALARNVGWHLRHVQADVKALEGAGLIDRGTGTVRVVADRLQADISL